MEPCSPGGRPGTGLQVDSVLLSRGERQAGNRQSVGPGLALTTAPLRVKTLAVHPSIEVVIGAGRPWGKERQEGGVAGGGGREGGEE